MTGEWQVARVRCNSAGEWKLLVSGTDMCQLLYLYQHPEEEPFPAEVLDRRLVELGWRPGRGGWRACQSERWLWRLPVYRVGV